MKIPSSVRYFNKRFLNRLTGKVARSSWGPFCIICHTGRRSGKPYETPIMAFPTAFGFVIVLTYGPEVDWYRNITAAGCCKIRWHARDYELQKVEPMEPKAALPLLPGFFRAVLGRVGFQDFVKLTGQSPRSPRMLE
jgi:deazaflavin-dependent oxidoreductase (nitroreductase family)